MNYKLKINQTNNMLEVTARNARFCWSKETGLLINVLAFDGIRWKSILSEGTQGGITFGLPFSRFELTGQNESYLTFQTIHENDQARLTQQYEVYQRGYFICDFQLEILKDEVCIGENERLGIVLDNSIFAGNFRLLNDTNDTDDPRFMRGLSVDFTTDHRPVTNSVSLLLEYPFEDTKGNKCSKIVEKFNNGKFVGWRIDNSKRFPKPVGYSYKNRWSMTVTGIDNSANKVRGQRIYTYYGLGSAHRHPTREMLEEMAEYGCSILHLHNWGQYISGTDPADEKEFKECIDNAHELGMKVIFYCQPFLMSINAPYHKDYLDSRTEGLRMWWALQETQIVSYEKIYDWDCDELCLRNKKAFEFIYGSAMEVYRKYNFDGLYIDFSWPAEEVCNNESHGHKKGLFGFYDYLKLIRQWRESLGEEKIMIGHGGGWLVSSDFVEGYDACLTGEAQRDLDPVTLQQQCGCTPTLWTMHRRKKREFRSGDTVVQLVREGVSPHVGVGIGGTSVMATLDPSHFQSLLPLWQMWRAFPVQKSTFYNYLTEQVVLLDNDEVYYSLFVTEDKRMLLILANAGGPQHDASPSVGVNVKIDVAKLGLPEKMNVWRMKGQSYETFRIQPTDSVKDGYLSVPEIMLHELVGFVFSPDEAPEELLSLQEHFKNMPDRMKKILTNKQKRLAQFDQIMDTYLRLPHAAKKMTYGEFMKDRSAE